MQIKSLANNIIVPEIHKSLNTIKGIIVSPALLNDTELKIQETLSDQGVINVEQVKRMINGELKSTPKYILTFNGTYLPPFVKVAEWHRELVELYIPNPMRCLRCQKLGHTKKRCRNEKEICRRCGGEDHKSQECTNDPSCVNCGLPHPANDNNCPAYNFRKEVIATQTRERITHFEATELVKERYHSEGRTYSFKTKQRTPREEDRSPPQSETLPNINQPLSSADENASTSSHHEHVDLPIFEDRPMQEPASITEETRSEIDRNATQSEKSALKEVKPTERATEILAGNSSKTSDKENEAQTQSVQIITANMTSTQDRSKASAKPTITSPKKSQKAASKRKLHTLSSSDEDIILRSSVEDRAGNKPPTSKAKLSNEKSNQGLVEYESDSEFESIIDQPPASEYRTNVNVKQSVVKPNERTKPRHPPSYANILSQSQSPSQSQPTPSRQYSRPWMNNAKAQEKKNGK